MVLLRNFLLYGHGGAYNHGAEAIVKTTIAFIRETYPDAQIILSSHFPCQDREFQIDADEIIGPDRSFWERERATDSIKEKEECALKMYERALAHINKDTLLLSVGGDNYCYPNWHRLAVFQKMAQSVGAKSILWFCSVEPGAISDAMLDVLGTHSLILARESITYDTLCAKGLREKTRLAFDPAYLLEPVPVPLPHFFVPGHTIGINISPLILRYASKENIIMENILKLLQCIVQKHGAAFAFIPHVSMRMDHDYALMYEIFSGLPPELQKMGCLIPPDYSASQYKYIISLCRALVCARTHASIAAYSSCVPVITLGYSVKSSGIGRDMGMEDFVLGVNDLTSTDQLCTLLDGLLRNEAQLKATMKQEKAKIPDTIRKTAEELL